MLTPTPRGQMAALHKQSLLLLLPSQVTAGLEAGLPRWMLPFLSPSHIQQIYSSPPSPWAQNQPAGIQLLVRQKKTTCGTHTQPESEGPAFYWEVTESQPHHSAGKPSQEMELSREGKRERLRFLASDRSPKNNHCFSPACLFQVVQC